LVKKKGKGEWATGPNGPASWAVRGRKEVRQNWTTRRVSAQEARKKEICFPIF
jgi:hypothetical protein